MTRRYVLTGGPGSGKSSIILALEAAGEYVIREAAEDYIKRRQAEGMDRPWEAESLERFQDNILSLQVQRESRVPDDIGRVFIDRGYPDGCAYYDLRGERYSSKMQDALDRLRYGPYDGVFIVENLGFCTKNTVRKEELDEALLLESLQERNYKGLGYDVKRIPKGPLEDRVRVLLAYILDSDKKVPAPIAD